LAKAALATADFDKRAKSLKTQVDDATNPLHVANPWLAQAIKAVHDVNLKIPRTMQQKTDDMAWKGQTDKAHREIETAKRALASVEGASTSVSTLAATQTVSDAERSRWMMLPRRSVSIALLPSLPICTV